MRKRAVLLFMAIAAALLLSSGTAIGVMRFNPVNFFIPGDSSGRASSYPSTINVSGLSGTITDLDVELNSFEHTRPDDVDMLLVGPGGQTALLMSDAGGDFDVVASSAGLLYLMFDDEASSSLPDNSQITANNSSTRAFSGLYKPTDYETGDTFPAPTSGSAPPAGPYGTALSAFDGTDPNGEWKLFVFDDSPSAEGGRVGNGFTLYITLTPPPNDAFAAAQNVSGVAASVPDDNVSATIENGEPFHTVRPGCCWTTGSHSVWYSWTAPTNGTATIDTCTSDFDTILAVYTGDTISTLSQLTNDNDSCTAPNDQGSKVNFDAQAGTTYRIAVAGFNFDHAGEGTFTLEVAGDTPPRVTVMSPSKTGIKRNTNVTATFSEKMDKSTLVTDPTNQTSTTFTLTKQGSTTPVAAKVSYDEATNTVTLDPVNRLAGRKVYIAKISGATDEAGNPLADTVWSFKTGRR